MYLPRGSELVSLIAVFPKRPLQLSRGTGSGLLGDEYRDL